MDVNQISKLEAFVSVYKLSESKNGCSKQDIVDIANKFGMEPHILLSALAAGTIESSAKVLEIPEYELNLAMEKLDAN